MSRFVVAIATVCILLVAYHAAATDLDDQLIDASFTSWKNNPPTDKSKAWERGFSDGQRLVFHTRLARDLMGCYVPVPGTPLP